ncbi:hypothetical protein CW304_01260 [Bacillus sp. UFRGS-B20]|nr:hypothetical protein CW304_01260 [Bacillus sp. UFRGS-B20]
MTFVGFYVFLFSLDLFVSFPALLFCPFLLSFFLFASSAYPSFSCLHALNNTTSQNENERSNHRDPLPLNILRKKYNNLNHIITIIS